MQSLREVFTSYKEYIVATRSINIKNDFDFINVEYTRYLIFDRFNFLIRSVRAMVFHQSIF